MLKFLRRLYDGLAGFSSAGSLARRGMNNPYVAAALVIVACISIHLSIEKYNKITFKEARDSIVLTKAEQEAMVKAFADGSAYTSGATTPPVPTSDPFPENGLTGPKAHNNNNNRERF